MAIRFAIRCLWTLCLLPSAFVQLERLNDKVDSAELDHTDSDASRPSSETYYDSGSWDDISTADLADALDPHTSPFWLAMVDAVAAHVSSQMPSTSLLQVNESLIGQHHLVRRLWQKVLGRNLSSPESYSDDEDVCATDAAQSPQSKHFTAQSQADKSDECESDEEDTLTRKSTQRTLPEEKTLTGIERFRNEVMQYLRTIQSFFLEFLRWDISWAFFGTGYDPLQHLPVIGFKCQPFLECMVGLFDFIKPFLKLLWKVVYEIGLFVRDLLAPVWASISGNESRTSSASRGTGRSPSGTEFNVHIPSDQEEPDIDVGDVIVDQDRLASDACMKYFRFKGSISLSLAGGASVKFMVGTVPLPFQKWKSELFTCGRKIASMWSVLISPSRWTERGREVTDLYFGEHECNPHTVGLCMLLEKSRACSFDLDTDGVIQDNAHSIDGESFCRVFDGVLLGLTKSQRDKRVRCTQALVRRYLKNGTSPKSIEKIESKSQYFDFGQGCRRVKERLQLTSRCEIPRTVEDVFLRCRKLFGCSRDSHFDPTLLKWEDYVGRVMDVITEAVPLLHRKDTSKLVSDRIDIVNQQGNDFRTQVDMAFFKPPATHDLDPHTLFMHPMWRDECFIDLSPVDSDEGVLYASAKALRRKMLGQLTDDQVKNVRRSLLSQHAKANKKLALPFFHRLSRGLRMDTWARNSSACERVRLDQATQPPPAEREGPKPTGLTQLMVKIDADGSGVQVGKTDEDGKTSVTFSTPGWGGTRTTLKATQLANYDWIVDECVGRHCNDMKTGAALMNLRIQFSNDEEIVQPICKSASQAMKSISWIQDAAPKDGFVFRTESDFKHAASILREHAKIMENNAKIDIADEVEVEEDVEWNELAKLVDPAVFYTLSRENPFEQNQKDSGDEYLRSRWSDGARNKLALFFRRRDWSFARDKATGLIELLHHGEEATAGEIKVLAQVLEQPRRGPVKSAGFAFHQIAVDLLTGLPQKVLLRGKTWDEKNRLDILAETLTSLEVKDGGCTLALLNMEHSLVG